MPPCLLHTYYVRAAGHSPSGPQTERAASEPAWSTAGWKQPGQQCHGFMVSLSLCLTGRGLAHPEGARCFGNWADLVKTEPPREWLSPQERGEHAAACALGRPRKTPLYPLVFHTENRFSRVFPGSGLASPVWCPSRPPWPPPGPARSTLTGLCLWGLHCN